MIDEPAGQRTLRRLVGAFYHPTIVPDRRSPAPRREQLRAERRPVKYGVRAGERIADGGADGHRGGRAKLAALQAELRRRGSGSTGCAARAGRAAVQRDRAERVLAADAVLPAGDLRPSSARWSSSACCSRWCVLMTAGLTQLFPGRPELMPIPFAAILVTLLYNGRIGVFAALTLALLLDGQWALRDSDILFFGLVGGVAGAIGIRVVRRRRHLYLTIGVMAARRHPRVDHRGAARGLEHVTIVRERLLGVLMAPASASLAHARDAARRVRHPHHHRSHPARALRSRPPAAPPAGARGARAPGRTASRWPTSASRPATSSARTACSPGSAATTTTSASWRNPRLLRREPGRRAQPARRADAR